MPPRPIVPPTKVKTGASAAANSKQRVPLKADTKGAPHTNVPVKDDGSSSRQSKYEKDLQDKILDYQRKVEESSDVLLPRVLDNMAKASSGCQGNLALIQGACVCAKNLAVQDSKLYRAV
jgi:hypothetical protein